MNDVQEIKRGKVAAFCRRGTVATLAGVGTVLAGAGTTFATATTPSEEAGTALTGMGTDGVSWVGTYVVPAVAGALGIGLVVALVLKFGKRIRSAF